MGDSWVFVCMMMVTLCTLAPQTASSDAFPEHLRKYFFASQVRYWISSRIISYCFYHILYSHIVSYFILLRKIILIEKYENYYFKNWKLLPEIEIIILWNYYLYLVKLLFVFGMVLFNNHPTKVFFFFCNHVFLYSEAWLTTSLHFTQKYFFLTVENYGKEPTKIWCLETLTDYTVSGCHSQ